MFYLKVSYIILSPATHSVRKLPCNLNGDDTSLFEHELRKEIHALLQISLNNILINGDGIVVAKKSTVFPDSFSRPTAILNISGVRFYYDLLKKVARQHLKIINSPAIFVLDNFTSAYFHWMTEVLPRLLAGDEDVKSYSVILPELYLQYPFITQSLQLLGIKVQYLHKHNYYLLRKVYFITHFASAGNYSDYFMQKTRTVFTNHLPATRPEKLVYISRNKAAYRKIANEEDIIPELLALHFETVYCEELSMQEQIRLFSQTKVLVANHGAGLTNLLFMPKGSVVLELRYKNDEHNNCYFALASALDIEYNYLQCSPLNFGEDPLRADILVNKERFHEELLTVLHRCKDASLE